MGVVTILSGKSITKISCCTFQQVTESIQLKHRKVLLITVLYCVSFKAVVSLWPAKAQHYILKSCRTNLCPAYVNLKGPYYFINVLLFTHALMSEFCSCSFFSLSKHLWEAKAWCSTILTDLYLLVTHCVENSTFSSVLMGSFQNYHLWLAWNRRIYEWYREFFQRAYLCNLLFPFFDQVFDDYCWWCCTIVFLWLAAVFFKWIFVLDTQWNLSAASVDVSW